MPNEKVLTSQLQILVGGSEIGATVYDKMLEVVVDQNVFLPAMFTIHLRDDRDLGLIDDETFGLTKEVEIKLQDEFSGSFVTLIKGEITALEPKFREGMLADLMVRGYDKSHRLYRETKSQIFLNAKDSDLASQIAGNAGLSPNVDTTTTVYDALVQDNQTDLAFLMQRAWRIGYKCYVDDGKLHFKKEDFAAGSAVTLKYGEDLLEFYPVASLAEQVSSAEVRGWDPAQQQAIVGQASSSSFVPSTSAGGDRSKADDFGTGKKVIVDLPVKDQAEANKLAQARLDEAAGAFIEARGKAFRRPNIRAGSKVKIEKVGTKFSGDYLVTNATHIYEAGGITTEFTVRGARSGLLAEQLTQMAPQARWPGIYPAVVTDTNDPQKLGRIKVQYPWLTTDHESFWARVVSPGAGPTAGFFTTPDVGDEVMVAFEYGDINRPYVLGGVWSDTIKIPASGEAAASGEVPLVRTWTSRTGHEIGMYDNADNKIEIKTAGGHVMVVDDANKKFNLKTASGNVITIEDQSSKLTIQTTNGHKLIMEASGVTLESAANLTIKASANISIEAGAMLDAKANGITSIKGSLVNIN